MYAEPRHPVSLNQRARRRAQRRRLNRSVTLQLHQHREALAQDLATEDAADIRNSRQFATMKQLPANGSDQGRQRLPRAVKNVPRRGIAAACGFIH